MTYTSATPRGWGRIWCLEKLREQMLYERLPQTWEAYENEENAIAYRGGAGYFYAIWKYIGDTKPA